MTCNLNWTSASQIKSNFELNFKLNWNWLQIKLGHSNFQNFKETLLKTNYLMLWWKVQAPSGWLQRSLDNLTASLSKNNALSECLWNVLLNRPCAAATYVRNYLNKTYLQILYPYKSANINPKLTSIVSKFFKVCFFKFIKFRDTP